MLKDLWEICRENWDVIMANWQLFIIFAVVLLPIYRFIFYLLIDVKTHDLPQRKKLEKELKNAKKEIKKLESQVRDLQTTERMLKVTHSEDVEQHESIGQKILDRINAKGD